MGGFLNPFCRSGKSKLRKCQSSGTQRATGALLATDCEALLTRHASCLAASFTHSTPSNNNGMWVAVELALTFGLFGF